MLVVMLSGKQGSGKSTTADSVSAKLSDRGKTYRTRFAKLLYELHDHIRDTLRGFGLNVPTKNGKLLQYIGTEFMRETVDQNGWVKCLVKDVEKAKENGAQYVLIDDMRFKNEFHAFDNSPNISVLTVRLECDRDLRRARCDGWRDTENHPSETDLDGYLDNFDLVIRTDVKTLDEVVNEILIHVGA